ncbi:Junctophilin-1, variant 2 [Schistosoma haematobium]|uniref:Junctophilin-1, variant 2 n=2 Tax=Schistosoma TaxID=6181 RepID=A0A922LEK6_SCHHA|nr:Junctophilin-1, variant 2 [Schistosoma haematobium]KAH9580814.1 Junctophilin-1, variant 2 [Schistosoma haematobium]
MDLVKTEATCLPAGRYEFKDSGLYIGEWLNEKAVGLGLITKDKCQGEYTGLWDSGSEKSGVFLWPNAPGAMYEGEWAHNRRNGYGIFTREDWVIMGQFKDDFIKCGIKCKEDSIGRFEGEFENGFPSFGVETYADGGSYAGEYKNGVREGLGVRTSIPYGEVINFFPEEAAIAAEIALDIKKRTALQNLLNSTHHTHHNITNTDNSTHHIVNNNNNNNNTGTRRGSLLSQRSGDVAELDDPELSGQDDNEDEPYFGRRPNPSNIHNKDFKDLRMSCKFKCGFVLSSKRSELMLKRQQKLNHIGSGSLMKFRKELNHNKTNRRSKSLTNLFNRSLSKESIACVRRQGSITEHSARAKIKVEQTPESVFTLDQVDAIDPETVETFAGQWEADSRHGYGVCERSDGVIYEGQWVKNQRHGYGQTHFPDGVCEQGKYQNGKLVFLSWPKGAKSYLLLYNYHIMREVANAVKRARNIADDAFVKANEARENLAKVENAVQLSKKAAELARDYSLETRELVKEMYPDFEQPGIKYLEDMVRLMNITKRGNQAFDTALQSAKDVIATVEANLIEHNQSQEQNLEENHEQNDLNYPSLDLDPMKPIQHNSGIPLSRAGSYRLKRHKKHHSNKHKHENDKMHSIEMKNIEYTTGNDIGKSLTLQIPQVNVDCSFSQQINNDKSILNNKFPSPIMTTTSENSLHVPNLNYYTNRIDNDISSECDSIEGESRTTRSSSEASNYVILPTFNILKPQTEPLTIPLNKLMSNTTVMDDYFGHYKMTPKQSPSLYNEKRYSMERLNESQHIHEIKSNLFNQFRDPKMNQYDDDNADDDHDHDGGDGDHSKPLSYDAKSATFSRTSENCESSKRIVRRRTLPGFLTQPPLDLSKYSNLTTLQENGITPSNNKSVTMCNQSSSRNTQNNLSTIQHLSNHNINTKHEQSSNNNSSVIYFTDNGIRKRAHAYSPIHEDSLLFTHLSQKNSMNNSGKLDSLKQISTLPISMSRDIQTSYLTNTNHINVMSTMTNTSQQYSHSRMNQSPFVVANVMIEDPQDQLTPLPIYYKESRIDLSQSIKRGSVPDVTKQSSTLSPNDLLKLEEEHKRKYENILDRKRQGEIVIQLVDFFDWCRVNLSILTFILVNCILACFFYIIIYS